MRSLTILCASVVAFSLLATPAKADSVGGTTNTVFLIIDLGGFSGDGTDEYQYYNEQQSNLLVINLASVNGTIEEFLGFTFAEIDLGDEFDLSEASFFILGHITGSDHLILSDATGDPGPIPDGYEDPLIDGIRTMDDMDPNLANPGGTALITPDDFLTQLGRPITDFSNPDPSNIPFDPVGVVGGEVDVLGFTDPVFLATVGITFEGGTIVGRQVPEPALAILAVLGLAGSAIARRRRRLAA